MRLNIARFNEPAEASKCVAHAEKDPCTDPRDRTDGTAIKGAMFLRTFWGQVGSPSHLNALSRQNCSGFAMSATQLFVRIWFAAPTPETRSGRGLSQGECRQRSEECLRD